MKATILRSQAVNFFLPTSFNRKVNELRNMNSLSDNGWGRESERLSVNFPLCQGEDQLPSIRLEARRSHASKFRTAIEGRVDTAKG